MPASVAPTSAEACSEANRVPWVTMALRLVSACTHMAGAAGGMLAVWRGFPLADPLLTIVVALASAQLEFRVIGDASAPLMDRAPLPPESLRSIIVAVPGVVHAHRVRIRSNASKAMADLDLTIAPHLTVGEANIISRELQRCLREVFASLPEIVVHPRPGRSDPVEVGATNVGMPANRRAHERIEPAVP